MPFGAPGTGLDFGSIRQEPIRGAVVQLLDASGGVLKTSETNASGDYSFTSDANTEVRVRVRAQMLRTTNAPIDTEVIDNTNGNAPYVLDGSLASSGTANQRRNLNAGSGWGGSSYTGTRAAAPFAILDTIYEATQVFIAVDPNIVFPELDVGWSVNNRSASGAIARGEITTSSYLTVNGVPTILILGDFAMDSDEYDEHVVSHEWGHYFENTLSRADSIGGPHSNSERLDARVAFGEGWGNALSGIVSGRVYRDSSRNGSRDFGIDMERNDFANEGFYSSGSVQSILYDIMDGTADGSDTISDGLGPIYRAFTSQTYKDVPEVTSIFAFSNALRSQSGIDAAALDALLNDQRIIGRGPAGAGETNNGGITERLPVHRTLTIGGPAQSFCSVNDAGTYNRLGNRAFFRFSLPAAQSVTLTMTRTSGPASADPYFDVLRRGRYLATPDNTAGSIESQTLNLPAGEYLVDAFDNINTDIDGAGHDSCFTLQAR
ncbi:hypothetical protein [uncultured Algimonas sp.]|uniref:hypothetical protein n=1 Tax=uncultured Algimonas sp. TaxID=1547920 RepID=UPI0026157626|nr:hypothetical protein [uncultured Algimonas sp.]